MTEMSSTVIRSCSYHISFETHVYVKLAYCYRSNTY